MVSRRLPRIPILAAFALSCLFMIGLAPSNAWAEVKTFSEDNQLSLDTYHDLGLEPTGLDKEAAKESAPLSIDHRTSILTHHDTYVAANGQWANTYTLRRNLNRLDDDSRGTGVEDDWGKMVGAYQFFKTSKNRDHSSDGHQVDSALSDNKNDVVKGATNNGFSGRYATSVAMSMGSGWKDHIAELRAYGDDMSTKGYAGAITIKVFKLDENGNRTEVASLDPVTDSYLSSQVSDNKHFRYLDAGYYQELDALFEIQAADVDDDGVDEIFSYTGAYTDKNGERYAVVDMFDYDASSKKWDHSTTELDAGQAKLYATTQEIADAARAHEDTPYHQYVKMAPVVTLAGGNLDRKGGDELAMTVSAPTDHDSPDKAARCYLYTWDASAKRLAGIDGLTKEIGSDYIPLYNPNPISGKQSEAMVSANCAFGTFETESGQTTLGLIIAGWDCGNASNLSKNNRYRNAGYRYVYYEPSKDSFVVSGYKIKELGKDAQKIVESATEDAGQDQRYVPTLAPYALSCARLQGLHQAVENDQVLFGGEVYNFSLANGLGDYLKSISMCSNQQNENSNTKGKEQVWIGDVVSGNVSGSDNYEESFLAVIGVHRDEDLGDGDDYYWMDVAHFSAYYSNDKLNGYRTAQEGVVCEGNHTHNRYGTWVSLALPNVGHRGIITQFVDMAKFYSTPQALAMLEDSPYYQDLQDSYHYISLGGTSFGRSRSTTTGNSFTLDAQVTIYGSYTRGEVGQFTIGGEIGPTFSYESQNAQTLSYNVSYASYAGEGNKVVAYAIPVVNYYYKILDLSKNPSADPNNPDSWGDMIVPEYQQPVTSVVSAEVWDQHADEFGGPKTVNVFANQSGDPSSYTADAMAKYPGATRAFTSENRTEANNQQGANITQEISTENEEGQTIGGGLTVGFNIGGGYDGIVNHFMAGVAFEGALGWSSVTSHSNAISFSGTVENLPKEAKDYSFAWKLAVNKSDPKMADDPEIVKDDDSDEAKNGKPDSNQFWIVGYEVENAAPSKADRNAISGLTVDGATDHSLKLTWNGNLPKDGKYNYGLAMVNGNGALSDWQVVPAGTTSYEWGKDTRQLSPSTEYRFVIAPVTGDTNNTAKQAGIRSAVLSASTLPKGDVLAMNGLEVLDPKTDDCNAKVEAGGTLTMRETATYQTHDAEGNEVYVAPKFTWYRVDPHSTQATRVAAGEDTDNAKLASSKDAIDRYLSAEPKLTGDADPHTSTYSTPVTASDDGSVWYCNVSYNNVVVASKRVNLDVTNTVEALDKSQASSGALKRSTYLKASKNGAGFKLSKGQGLKGSEASALNRTAESVVTIGKSTKVSFPAAEGKVRVTSSKSKVAQATYKNGTVTIKGLKAGTATVTAEAAGNHATLTIAITVTKRPNPITVATTVTCGSTKKVGVSGAKGKVTVKTSDKKIAKASYKDGKVVIKGVRPGKAKVTVTAAGTDTYRAASKVVKVTVAKRHNPLKVSYKKVTFKRCKAAKVRVIDAKGKVTVKSSNKNVAKATYKKGKVTIKRGKNGHATIKVTAKGTGTYAKGSKEIRVTVKR